MNIDRGKTEFSLEERKELAQQLRAFKDDSNVSWTRVEELTGIAGSTCSVICGKSADLSRYGNEPFARIHKFLLAKDIDAMLEQEAAVVPSFQPTKTAKRIHTLLGWARRGKMVAIVGDPGVGKTAALKQYAANTPNVWLATASPSSASVPAMLLMVLQALGIPRTSGARQQLSLIVRDSVGNRNGVLIIDEAQHLGDSALEELRSIHDTTGVGIVFSGNRDVLTRIEGQQRSRAFAQFFSRVSFRHIFDLPEAEDVATMLTAWKVTHPRARNFLTAIAMKPGGGAIRQMSMVLELATNLAQGEGADLSFDYIEGAAHQLKCLPSKAQAA